MEKILLRTYRDVMIAWILRREQGRSGAARHGTLEAEQYEAPVAEQESRENTWHLDNPSV